MALDELRKKVIYQNTIDVWIGVCEEKNLKWDEPENYKKFVKYLLNQNLQMKKFPLCISDAESTLEISQKKAKFAELLSEENDPKSSTYTVRLNDSTMELIRNFSLN